MLQDSSPDFEETWKFIDRRFEDISGLTSAVNHLQDLSSGQPYVLPSADW